MNEDEEQPDDREEPEEEPDDWDEDLEYARWQDDGGQH
jgi:hypothetical protein